MSTGDGAALADLAAKVEEVGRLCARLGQENAELRDEVARLRGGGAAGDLYVDSTARLWFCKGGTTWKVIVGV